MQPNDPGPLLPQKHIAEHTTIETQKQSKKPLWQPPMTIRPNVPQRTATVERNHPTSSGHTTSATAQNKTNISTTATTTHILNRLLGGRLLSEWENKGLLLGAGPRFISSTLPTFISHATFHFHTSHAMLSANQTNIDRTKNSPAQNSAYRVFHAKKQIEDPNSIDKGRKSKCVICLSENDRNTPVTCSAKGPEKAAIR